jgi:hypothetical protein
MDPFVATLSGDTALRVLFIGGSGVISAAAAQRAVAVGHRLTILNRGTETLRPRSGRRGGAQGRHTGYGVGAYRARWQDVRRGRGLCCLHSGSRGFGH